MTKVQHSDEYDLNKKILHALDTHNFNSDLAKYEGGHVIKWGKPIKLGVLGKGARGIRRFMKVFLEDLSNVSGHEFEYARGGDINFVIVLSDSIVDDALGQYRETFEHFLIPKNGLPEIVDKYKLSGNKYLTKGEYGERGIQGAIIFVSKDQDVKEIRNFIIKYAIHNLGLFDEIETLTDSILAKNSRFVHMSPIDCILLKTLYDKRRSSRNGRNYNKRDKLISFCSKHTSN